LLRRAVLDAAMVVAATRAAWPTARMYWSTGKAAAEGVAAVFMGVIVANLGGLRCKWGCGRACFTAMAGWALAYAGKVNRVIHIQLEAPPKPPEGQPCNGCGVCCLAEPCPVGVLVSRRFKGACAALRWSDAGRRYNCGLLGDADWAGGAALAASGMRGLLRRVWRAWARRVIASGIGCDAGLEVERP
jgi:hypothetical protein